MVSELKRALFAGTGDQNQLFKCTNLFRRDLKSLDTSELLDATYYLTRITRGRGGIVDPELGYAIIGRLMAAIPLLSRQECIRLVQVCSLLVSRNKVDQPHVKSLLQKRDKVVVECLRRISGKLEDLPVSMLSVLISAVARQHCASIDPFIADFSDCVSVRIEACLADSHEPPKNASTRLDLERLVPFVFLAFEQMDIVPSSRLSEASLNLYSRFASEIPFSHMSQLVLAFPKEAFESDPRWDSITSYCREAVEKSPADFTLIDLCRLVNGLRSDKIANILYATAPNRPSKEWSIHALKESSLVFQKFKMQNKFGHRFLREMKMKASEIPSSYLIAILRNTHSCSVKISIGASTLLSKRISKLTDSELCTVLTLDVSEMDHNSIGNLVSEAKAEAQRRHVV